MTPFFCNPNASSPPLGTAIDAQCNAPTRVELLYRNMATPPQFVPYDPASPPPAASIGQTTTDAGKTVPFVVQRVTGTANRGIYQIAVLVDPTKAIEPWSTSQPWSRKLFHTFGGACGNQHVQTAPGNVLQAAQLGLGFAVATSSLNIYANNCSDLTSAEATMMTKEIVVERYGPLLYTMGSGGSAASMQQHLLAENYPGLLDGLSTSQVFPDHLTQVLGSLDCRLLYHYFWPTSPLLNPGHAASPPNALFPSAASRLPVWGSNPTNPDNLCGQKILAFGADRTELLPASGVGCGLPAALIWSPTNPTGERCGTFDFLRAVFGVVVTPDAPNGKGRSATDNVGVEYGLNALLAGQITPEQFVDLNSKIGGIDIDGNFTPERKAADPAALEILYDTGRMNSGSGAADTPEIDNRTGFQMDDTGFHPAFETFSYRARLDRSNGHHANQIVWLSRPGGVVPSQFDALRQWLDNLAADTSGDPQSVKVQRAKPADLVDTCFMADGVRGDMTCNGTWQHYAAPRIAAGGPLTQDVMKCRTKPLSRPDYGVIAFTDDAVGSPAGRLPDRRVRLREARCVAAAAEGALAHLRERSRRAAARRGACLEGAGRAPRRPDGSAGLVRPGQAGERETAALARAGGTAAAEAAHADRVRRARRVRGNCAARVRSEPDRRSGGAARCRSPRHPGAAGLLSRLRRKGEAVPSLPPRSVSRPGSRRGASAHSS